MSTRAAASSAPATPLPAAAGTKPAAAAGRALALGLAGLAATAAGFFLTPDTHAFALAYLTGLSFWIAVAIGMLIMVMIHYVLDASWSVALRRQYEHWLAGVKWLALLFVPLLVATWVKPGSIWPWTDLATPLHGGHGTIGDDILYIKKSAFLNPAALTLGTIAFFGLWMLLAARLRACSFAQDDDGDLKWTRKARVAAAAGLPVMAVTLTLAAIYWMKSLEYHWFSTMYGVWFFADCARAALSIGVLLSLRLYSRGDYKGILNTHHLHSVGQLIFAFTVFWAYISFSQYFLIWNANVPEETFWYNLRELSAEGAFNQWGWVGMALVFGHFLLPFLYLLSYKNKVTRARLRAVVVWILVVILIDLCYNILPAAKDARGQPQPFLSLNLLWVLTTLAGAGGLCAWAYLRSLPTRKLIPIRDPRIDECLTHHD
ncbi:MAG: hypothetical protein LBI02_09565 [Opitutaceae bacterium]|jgi:hypothetical protein|nr:hypothetical protein [Opitutaceae bacterium]